MYMLQVCAQPYKLHACLDNPDMHYPHAHIDARAHAHAMTHPPGHDRGEARSEGRRSSSTEAFSSTAEAGLCAAVHTVATDRTQEVASDVVIDAP